MKKHTCTHTDARHTGVMLGGSFSPDFISEDHFHSGWVCWIMGKVVHAVQQHKQQSVCICVRHSRWSARVAFRVIHSWTLVVQAQRSRMVSPNESVRRFAARKSWINISRLIKVCDSAHLWKSSGERSRARSHGMRVVKFRLWRADEKKY